MVSIQEAFSSLPDELNSIVDVVDLPARVELRRPIPSQFMKGAVGGWLRERYAPDGALWNHQALALESIARDRNVVLATDTASGKSLVFYAAAYEHLTRHPDARFLVFYPQIALANDQLVHWRQAAADIGFSSSIVGEIHGGVRKEDRFSILRDARVVLMTPDVCQAWLLRFAGSPEVRVFLANISAVFLDEAHVFEGVMGSNVALLMRRLAVARGVAREDRETEPLRVVAASATIANPGAHLRALFGVDVEIIGVDADGSPSHAKRLVHVAADDERQASLAILKSLLERSESGAFIAFADSRQGVERLARDLEHAGVRPYRSGYEQEDRRAIEEALRKGELRGVVSTSALELGINIPFFEFGLNIGVPNSRKAMRQRVGRVGRFQEATFAIVADRFAFRRLGSTLGDYWRGSIEPSHLYVDNRFIQFAHARCMAEELESMGRRPTPLPQADWPEDFSTVYAFALPGAARPTAFDAINQLGGDDPHRNYPLRNVGEVRYAIVDGPERVGEIALQQAIREAYPGAVYLHLMRSYRVFEWRTTVFDRAIRVGKSGFPGPTKPITRTWVNAAVEPEGIVEGHYLSNDDGFLTECQLQITERVEGYEERGQRKLYKDLRARNSAMKSKMREFRTTGVVLRLGQDWFRLPENKRALAVGIRELVMREYSIAPQDIDVAYTNISLLQNGRRVAISDALVLFDSTYGSLRLSEPAFTSAPDLVARLKRAASLVQDPSEAPVPVDVLDRLQTWLSQIRPSEIVVPADTTADGFLRVFKPGSIVARHGFNSGTPVDTVIIEPILMEGSAGPELCYRCKDVGPGREYILQQSAVVGVGDDWYEVLWNASTGEYIDEESSEEAIGAAGV